MKTVAIYAPISNPAKRANVDFTLRLKETGQELSFEFLHQWANNSFALGSVGKRTNDGSTPIAVAGYYLTSLLRLNGYNTILTPSVDKDSLNSIARQNPVAFCISSTMILDKESLASIIEQIRQTMKDVIIIVGGILLWKSYLWMQKAEVLAKENSVPNDLLESTGMVFPCCKSEIDADVMVVSSHGGDILLRILDEICKKGRNSNFENLPNLALPGPNGNFYFTRRVDETINYDQDYIHWEVVDELPSKIPIRTSVGCPYRCGYCDFCYLFPKIKYRSTESLKTELSTIKKLLVNNPGMKQTVISFSDDNIFITPKRADEICDLLIDMNLGLSWSGFLRVSSIDESNIQKIKQSGLERAWLGVESGDQEQLNRMNKKQNIEIVKRGIELLDSVDIATHMSYVIGYVGESDTSIQNTIDFINHLKVINSVYILYPLTIMPMSDISLTDLRKEWNVKGIFREWSHKTMDAKTAVQKSIDVFKHVTNVPYYYSQENHSFLQNYDSGLRKELYFLRQKITVAFMEREPWENIAQLFSKMAMIMGINAKPPAPETGQAILYPEF